jgi:hypothetical protein
MDISQKRIEREQRERYRERAIKRVAGIEGITVQVNVSPTIDGAFVEAVIWVSDKELEDAK